ncbi:hypothetical protein [Emticicia aquatilis]|nr:hypothetical protein [Emticicia aquatilis]
MKITTEILKELIDKGGILGVLIVGTLLAGIVIYQGAALIKSNGSSNETTKHFINKYTLLFSIVFLGIYIILILQLLFTHKDVIKEFIKEDTTQYAYLDTTLTKQRNEVVNRITNYDSTSNYLDDINITLSQIDTVFINEQLYNSKIAMKEEQTYNDLKTLLQISVNSIDPSNKIVKVYIKLSGFQNQKKQILLNPNKKEIFYIDENKKYSLSFSNLSKINNIKLVYLNINEIL